MYSGIVTNCVLAFDDQTSTFIIPSGAGFEVIFCPGGRSTRILETSTDKLHQLAEWGFVSKDNQGQSNMISSARSEALRNTVGLHNLRLGNTVVAVSLFIWLAGFTSLL